MCTIPIYAVESGQRHTEVNSIETVQHLTLLQVLNKPYISSEILLLF